MKSSLEVWWVRQNVRVVAVWVLNLAELLCEKSLSSDLKQHETC